MGDSILDYLFSAGAAERIPFDERRVLARQCGRTRAMKTKAILDVLKAAPGAPKIDGRRMIALDANIAVAANSVAPLLAGLSFEDQVVIIREEMKEACEEWCRLHPVDPAAQS